MNGLTQEIYEQIYNVFDGLESNSFETLGKPEVCMFEKPLIGVAAGDDPYYDFLKEHIGEFHWSPAKVFPCDNWVVSRGEWESIAFWCFKMVDFNVPWFDAYGTLIRGIVYNHYEIIWYNINRNLRIISD